MVFVALVMATISLLIGQVYADVKIDTVSKISERKVTVTLKNSGTEDRKVTVNYKEYIAGQVVTDVTTTVTVPAGKTKDVVFNALPESYVTHKVTTKDDSPKVETDEKEWTGTNPNATSVGGYSVPICESALLAPCIGITSTLAIATVATAICIRRIKHRKEKQ